jgi:hypothetical protein
MSRVELQRMLEQLHEELEHTRSDDVDERSRELLRSVMQDLRELDAEAEEDQTLLDRLGEAARDFEKSHPKLAAAVGRVMDTLSNLGI